MGNEGGTWIMYGVASDDPECLHTPEELIQYIEKIGFLPKINQRASFTRKEGSFLLQPVQPTPPPADGESIHLLTY